MKYRRASGFILLAFVALATLLLMPAGIRAQDSNQAALIIRYAENDSRAICVQFDEPQISGFELLQRSGLDLQIGVQGLGSLVCNINDTGCPSSDCLCQCKGGGDCVYWSYWHRLDESWQYSQGGATVYMVEAGAVEGWSWGPGAVNQAVPPPDITLDDVCQAAATSSPTVVTTKVPTRDEIAIVYRVKTDAKETAPLALDVAGVAPTVGADNGHSNINGQDPSTISRFDSLPYLIFLVIIVGLGGLLWFVSFRRRRQQM